MSLRVLVVEDSRTVNAALCGALTADPAFEVVGRAFDGDRAVALCEELRPDVISLDMALPGRNGLEVTQAVMARFPTPILIVSASMNRDEQMSTYDSLGAGAIDLLPKPDQDTDFDAWAVRYRKRLALIARIPVITHVRGRRPAETGAGQSPMLPARADRPSLIAIGGSTGSPQVLGAILREVGADLSAPTLILIHTSIGFDQGLSRWLSRLTSLPVAMARDSERLGSEPRLIVAPAGRHLVSDGATLWLDDGPARNHCKPSVDVLFESLRECASSVVAILLSGMGRDGADGMAVLRGAGAVTIAQDEASSVVWGMPGAAVQRRAACDTLDPATIASYLRR